MLRVVSCLVVLSLGCGLTQVKGPAANRPANVRPDCTTTDRPLKIDAAVGVTGLFLALFGGILYQTEPSNPEVLEVMIIGGLATTAVMLVSSGIGYSKVKRCRTAVEDFDRASMQPYPPGTYPAPPPGTYPPGTYPAPPPTYPAPPPTYPAPPPS